MNNQMSVDASEIEQIALSFQKTSDLLNHNVLEKTKNDFKGLSNCNLFSEGLETINNNAEIIYNSLTNMHKSIISHLNSIIKLEDNHTKMISSYTGKKVIERPVENKASIIDTTIINLQNTGKESYSNLIHNIGILKGKISFDDILFNNEKNKDLFKILKDQLKLEGEFNEEEIKKIKIAFINKMFSEDIDNKELKLNTAYILKEYLIDFAKENNITIGELFVDHKYSEIYKRFLHKIYEGGIYNSKISAEDFENIKNYLFKKFEMNKNNINTSTQVLNA